MHGAVPVRPGARCHAVLGERILRSPAKEIGEIAFYILLAMLLVTLWQQLLNYCRWRWTHRAMPLIYLALVCHSVVLMSARFWVSPLGLVFAAMYAVGSVAAIISLLGRIGESRTYDARVQSLRLLGSDEEDSDGWCPLELVCAMPANWRGHQPGQFVFLAWAAWRARIRSPGAGLHIGMVAVL